MTHTPCPTVANVIAVYRAATASDIREGLSWYADAHDFARLLDPENPARAAGIIAALSPMMSWDTNKLQASRVYANGSADGCGLRSNCTKADRIFNGESPESVIGGKKVMSFFQTILNPAGDFDPVIDRHAFDIAVGEVTDDKRRGALSRKGVYEQFGAVYREAAHIVGVSPSQLQAITWVAWRRLKNA